MDYRTLITSEHQLPKFLATVDLVANGAGQVATSAAQLITAFDLDQAVGAQLDILGVIIGQSRNVANILLVEFFGFQDDLAALTMGELTDPSVGGRFYNLGDTFASSSTLQDPEYRTVLRAKIARNQWDGSITGVEAALSFILPGVQYSITDVNTRIVSIAILSTSITAVDQTLLTSLDLLPRSCGVKYNLTFS